MAGDSADARRPRRRAPVVVTAALVPAALGVGLLAGFAMSRAAATDPGPGASSTPSTSASLSPTSPVVTPSADPWDAADLDALARKQVESLHGFVAWLEENDADGFVGEVGWPSGADPEWTALGERWYAVAEDAGLWTTAWAAGTAWPDDYVLATYGDGGSGSLSVGSDQASVIESLESAREASTTSTAADGLPRHGVNVGGLEFGTGDGFSQVELGELGTDYFAEPAESYEWLAQRGIDLVRLPVRWERLQPALEGALSATYAATVTAQLDAAAGAGIDVILDLHNYGAYVTDDGLVIVDSEELPVASLTDVWLRMSERWRDHDAVIGYGLMNEPHSHGGAASGGAERWEEASQEVVSALREVGDGHLILVAGYDWSSLVRWRDNHPTAWIADPAGNVRYEAHHYWDTHGVGAYTQPYDAELASLTSSGEAE